MHAELKQPYCPSAEISQGHSLTEHLLDLFRTSHLHVLHYAAWLLCYETADYSSPFSLCYPDSHSVCPVLPGIYLPYEEFPLSTGKLSHLGSSVCTSEDACRSESGTDHSINQNQESCALFGALSVVKISVWFWISGSL